MWVLPPALIAALALVALPARAERVVVEAVGCPGSGQLVRALTPLLPGAAIEAGVPAAARVVDLGGHYRVEAAEESLQLADGARDCEARAGAAAVWIALRLRPPTVVTRPEPGGPALAPATRWPWHAELELSLAGDVAPTTAGAPASIGGALRVAGGRGPISVALGGGAFTPFSLALPPGSANVLRVPFDAALRGSLTRGRFEGDLEAGAQLAVLLVQGRGFPVDERATRMEPAVRVAVRARVRLAPRWAVFAAVALSLVPAPHALVLGPDRRGVEAPWLWLTVEAGVSARLR